MNTKNILLIEPGYPNKYPPLGLMKLASYHGPNGRGDNVIFVKGEAPGVLDTAWDRVYVTTLFSFEWNRTAAAIDFAVRAARGQQERVFVGGIAASLMHDAFLLEPRWAGVRFIKGLLDGPPSLSLRLSAEEFEFGAEDLTGKPIEELIPDYSILDHVVYRYPVNDAYFGYASRGCIRKCAFCGVPALEGDQREMPPLTELVNGIRERHGEKKDMVLMDNNITASSRYQEVIAEIVDLGFERGATLARDGKPAVKRRVDFNQGVDARILAKSPMFLKEMAKVCISPLRIAFDHMGVRKPYIKSVHMAADNEITSLSNYMLYNFMDTPEDLYERMLVNIHLNEERGIHIWSFPMRYQPLQLKDRSHVGKNWNRYYLRSFQIMLQATRGVVSGNPSFFRHAYGQDQQEFLHLISLPHAFIFHRDYFQYGEGRSQRDEYEALRRRLSESQEKELIRLLAGPQSAQRLDEGSYFRLANDHSIDPLIRQVVGFHTLGTKYAPSVMGPESLPLYAKLDTDQPTPPEDEVVEDAGLFDHDRTIEALGLAAELP
ncbi:MAG: radical SAM protein [Chloroflexi bacterium]|nr:radical SAM protein [Chloroflexota bacterium]